MKTLNTQELSMATVVLKAITVHFSRNGISMKQGLSILKRVVQFFEDRIEMVS